jgi:quercetin dioxygenase-like cupin family protein
MEISPGHAVGTRGLQLTSTFTGEVWADPIANTREGVTVHSVAFLPGARSYWHSHERGQILQVIAGEGRVAVRGAKPHTLQPGDTVWTAPGEEHWHGAPEHTFLVHVAVSLGSVNWAEEVTQDHYAD